MQWVLQWGDKILNIAGKAIPRNWLRAVERGTAKLVPAGSAVSKVKPGEVLTKAQLDKAKAALPKTPTKVTPKTPAKKQDAPAAATETKASKAAKIRAERKAKRAADKKRAAKKKAQAAKDSKAAQESKVGTVAPSKAKRLTQKEIDAAKNLPVPSGKRQLPVVTPKKPPLPINLAGLQNKYGLKFTKGETAAIAGIATVGGIIAYVKSLVGEREELAERKKKDTAIPTSAMKGDHPGDPKPHTYKAKAEPKKEQATNAQLRKYYDDIEKIRGGAVTGETVTFDKKTYGGATGPAWQEFSKAWEKKYKKPEDLTISKLAKKAKVTSSKRGGGQVSRRPVKYSTMKKMYSHGGPVRKPTRI
jgi:hypothetical protein